VREQILDAAQQLVQERGIQAVSFQDIANAVGLKKPSLFHHFANKEALVAALLERCRTSYGARYAEVLDADAPAPEKLKGIIQLFDAALKKDQPCLLAALGYGVGELSDPLRDALKHTAESSLQRYTTVFVQGRNEGSLRFSGSPEHAAQAFLGMLQGLQILLRAEGRSDGLAATADAMVDSITVGSDAIPTKPL